MPRQTILAKGTTAAASTAFTVAFEPVTVALLFTDSTITQRSDLKADVYLETGETALRVAQLDANAPCFSISSPGTYHVKRGETASAFGITLGTA